MMAYAPDDPSARRATESDVPLGRIGTPEDIVGVMLFLASRAGAYLTAAVIPVDGGVGCR
jgi:NAD(P)-dependent dehydrogenase (short-subunit alcohol dehydrogenase family)